MKLTKTERKALELMSKTSRVNFKLMPATVKSLLSKGLAERTFSIMSYNRAHFAIVDAGRAALKEGK